MMRKISGQSISEYALIFGIVIAALAGMQLYFKRGIQAVIKAAADEIGNQQDGTDEVDPLKGLKHDRKSNIERLTSAGLSGNPEMEPGSTERTRVFEGGARRVDLDRIVTTNGTSEYRTDKDE